MSDPMTWAEAEDLAEVAPTAVPIGFDQLDRVLGGGLVPGEYAVLATRTGWGKTSFAGQLAHQYPGPALIYSAQMPGEYVSNRQDSQVMKRPTASLADLSFADHMKAVSGQLNRVRFYTKTFAGFEKAIEWTIDFESRCGYDQPLCILVDELYPFFAGLSQLACLKIADRIADITRRMNCVTWLVTSFHWCNMDETLDKPPRELLRHVDKRVDIDRPAVVLVGSGGEEGHVITVAKNRFGDTAHVPFEYDGPSGFFRETANDEVS